jgi:zinc/manganese transport system substrate-binding protein
VAGGIARVCQRRRPRVDLILGISIVIVLGVRLRLLLRIALPLAVLCVSAGQAQAAASLRVVAAENFWGSIASQLGGNRTQVTSVITNPSTDPHDYEPTAVDARTLAGAQLVIVDGIGYDPWAPELLAANPVKGRIVLTVGDLLGVKPGGNPHRWYSPADVQRVIAAIVADYKQLDPKDARYFDAQKVAYETKGLRAYKAEIALIRRTYSGVKVGASESIFAMLSPALGLDLITPPAFLEAISEGADPTAADKTTIDRQIADHEIKVWIYNSQNSTPDVQRLTDEARKQGIPVTTITETLSPANATFQAWQLGQLKALAAALAKATGR